MLDYGQVKDLPDKLRIGYANLVLAMADNDSTRAMESFRCNDFLSKQSSFGRKKKNLNMNKEKMV